MKKIATIACALGVLATADTARADRFELSAAGGSNFAPMESMDALSADRSYASVSLGAAARLPEAFPRLEGFESEVDLSWSLGSTGGRTFERIESDLSMERVELGLRLRRALHTSLSAYGRAGVGWTWADLRLEDQGSSLARPIESEDRAFTSSAALGMDFTLRASVPSRLHVGLRAEIGYAAMTSFDFSSTPEAGEEGEIRIPTMSADIGSVNASGAQLRFGLFGRF